MLKYKMQDFWVKKSISQNLVLKFDVFVADDCSVYVLELRALWSEAQRWIPLHNDTGTASGAEDDYTSLWVSIIIKQQRHVRQRCFFKSQLLSN